MSLQTIANDRQLTALQDALDRYCLERVISDDNERNHLAALAHVAFNLGLLAFDEVTPLVAIHTPQAERCQGLREWYIRRLRELVGIRQSEAVGLVDRLGLDWDALLKEARALGKTVSRAPLVPRC